ncbi:MAG: metal-dependent hydrolase [Acidobacteriota bacterium]|nr:metal-dependent hydrolase [Acidobacteriota bacterium]
MDPLTHTLAGATLAQTRLGRGTLATVTCVVGANLPDVDAATYFVDSDLALGVRRGWTHGALAMAVLPLLLAVIMSLIDRVRCQRLATATPVPTIRFVLLSYVAVLTHPALDWLNTYGVRLLMPFDDRWFYGDAVFIIDPWLWLLLATTVVLAHSSTRMLVIGWIGLGLVALTLVTGDPRAPTLAKILFVLGLATICGLRAWGGFQQRLTAVATACVFLATGYATAMSASSRLARLQVETWARARGVEPRQVMMSPVPGDPFRRRVLMADDRHYHHLVFDWRAGDRVQPTESHILIGHDHPATAAALTAKHVWGLSTWTRFPRFDVQPREDGYRVTIADLRFGSAVVDVDRNLVPHPPATSERQP